MKYSSEAQELRQASSKLRNTNAALAYDLRLIRAVGYFPTRKQQKYFEELASNPDFENLLNG